MSEEDKAKVNRLIRVGGEMRRDVQQTVKSVFNGKFPPFQERFWLSGDWINGR